MRELVNGEPEQWVEVWEFRGAVYATTRRKIGDVEEEYSAFYDEWLEARSSTAHIEDKRIFVAGEW